MLRSNLSKSPLVLSALRSSVLSGLEVGFNPSALFSGGDEGAWFDRSDIATLFQDSTGTTPVTAAGQSDALKLDKSQGLVKGPELVTNGDFATDSDWSKAPRVTISSGALRFDTASNGGASQNITLVAGVFNEVTITVSELVRGSDMTVFVGDTSFTVSASVGTNTLRVPAIIDVNTWIRLQGIFGTGLEAVISNVSVRELPGNHATQATSSAQSKYQFSPPRSEYDGNDDFSSTPLKPTTSGTIALRMRSDTASRVAFGSQPASDGKCYIGLASDGSLAGGIGTQATSTIKGSDDIRGVWTTGILTWDGTDVALYQDGVSVYSAAQVGAVNTTIDFYEGALNNNGTAAAFTNGGIARSIVFDRVMTAPEIANITTLWSTIE